MFSPNNWKLKSNQDWLNGSVKIKDSMPWVRCAFGSVFFSFFSSHTMLSSWSDLKMLFSSLHWLHNDWMQTMPHTWNIIVTIKPSQSWLLESSASWWWHDDRHHNLSDHHSDDFGHKTNGFPLSYQWNVYYTTKPSTSSFLQVSDIRYFEIIYGWEIDFRGSTCVLQDTSALGGYRKSICKVQRNNRLCR